MSLDANVLRLTFVDAGMWLLVPLDVEAVFLRG